MSEEFVIYDDTTADDEADGLESPIVPADETLNRRRIQSTLTDHRAVHRQRAWTLVAAGVMAAASGQFCWFAVLLMQSGAILRTAASGVIATGFAWGTCRAFRYAQKLTKEAKPQEAAVSTGAPDFSTLGDGSQFVRNLEHIDDDV